MAGESKRSQRDKLFLACDSLTSSSSSFLYLCIYDESEANSAELADKEREHNPFIHEKKKFVARDCHRENSLAPRRNSRESLCKTVPHPPFLSSFQVRNAVGRASFGSVSQSVRLSTQKRSLLRTFLARSKQKLTWPCLGHI